MRTPWIWSISLGRWWNVHFRLHMFFLLCAAFALYLSSHTFDQPTFHDASLYGQANWLGVVFSLTLLLSVLLHEIGHVTAARRLGGVADEIVIGPVGGLTAVRVPYEPQSELIALMAGPLVNAAICLVTALLLTFGDAGIDLVKMLNPMSLGLLKPGEELTTLAVLKVVFWTNWILILANLIPAFPFDAGHTARALLTVFWPEMDARQSRVTICRIGMVVSVLLLVLAWFTMSQTSQEINLNEPRQLDTQLTWFVLMLLSIYIFFNARREGMQPADLDQNEETVFGYDFSQGYTSLERSLEKPEMAEDNEVRNSPSLGIVGRWMEKRRETQRQRQLAQELEDERRVDEILSRLHERGMRSLSPDDRALLDRVSKRYRSRPN